MGDLGERWEAIACFPKDHRRRGAEQFRNGCSWVESERLRKLKKTSSGTVLSADKRMEDG